MPEGRIECEVKGSLQIKDEEVRTEKLEVGDREPDKAEAMNSALRGPRLTTRSSNVTSGAKRQTFEVGQTKRPGQTSESDFAGMTDVVRDRHDVKGVSQNGSKDFEREK